MYVKGNRNYTEFHTIDRPTVFLRQTLRVTCLVLLDMYFIASLFTSNGPFGSLMYNYLLFSTGQLFYKWLWIFYAEFDITDLTNYLNYYYGQIRASTMAIVPHGIIY